MPRGGPRPGPGAPRGNVNALKHGRYSRHQQRLLDLVRANPELLDLFEKIALSRDARRRRALRDAQRIFKEIEDRALDAAARRYEINQRIPPVANTE
ncbi:MAG: hypothetical protein Q7T33_06710 [Dehalococcoidia bacterium]|nr:hypothetical protein [Dehalococcoidia bacterium]